MTSDESELAWWRIMWGTERTKFHKATTPNDSRGKKVVHQNTCGHGYMPKGKYFLIDHEKGQHYSSSNGRSMFNRGTRTTLGASPSERAFRDFEDHRKRWSNT